jgi:hypothetical protein
MIRILFAVTMTVMSKTLSLLKQVFLYLLLHLAFFLSIKETAKIFGSTRSYVKKKGNENRPSHLFN